MAWKGFGENMLWTDEDINWEDNESLEDFVSEMFLNGYHPDNVLEDEESHILFQKILDTVDGNTKRRILRKMKWEHYQQRLKEQPFCDDEYERDFEYLERYRDDDEEFKETKY